MHRRQITLKGKEEPIWSRGGASNKGEREHLRNGGERTGWVILRIRERRAEIHKRIQGLERGQMFVFFCQRGILSRSGLL